MLWEARLRKCFRKVCMIQLTKSGIAGTANCEELAQEFERSHVFRLPGLLHPGLLQTVSPLLKSCSWSSSIHQDIAIEENPVEPASTAILQFAINSPDFLNFMRKVTRCEEIKWFQGRVYRMAAQHYDSWHGDVGGSPDRLIGMSINLGLEPYEGGVFHLRERKSCRPICALSNTGPGDGICFRLSRNLEHMVTPVSDGVPKTAFAGWFVRGEAEDFYSLLRRIRPAV